MPRVARVAEQIDEDTRVLIGHSLGSVVAFEAACRAGPSLPLLITLGSPLGLRTIIYDRRISSRRDFQSG